MNLCRSVAVFLLPWLVSPAWAMDLELSGFGSFIGGKSSHDTPADFRSYTTTDLDFSPDSLAGIQILSHINPRADITVQVVAAGVDNWQAGVNWAYLNYRVNPGFSWRIGRMTLPVFLFSESVQVGYSYPWITPPIDVYNIPLQSTDGAGITLTRSLGGVDLRWESYIGSAEFTMNGNYLKDVPIRTSNQIGTALEASWSDWRFRLGYHESDLTVLEYTTDLWKGLKIVADGLQQEGNTRIADRLYIDDDRIYFSDVALMYDDGTWLAIAETKRNSGAGNIPTPLELGDFITGGRRFSDVLLHLTYTRNKDRSEHIGRGLPETSAWSQAVDIIDRSIVGDSDGWIAGLRWDFSEGVAFKSEVSEITDNSDDQSYYTSAGSYRLVRMGIEAIF
jgi:hypothetical protein